MTAAALIDIARQPRKRRTIGEARMAAFATTLKMTKAAGAAAIVGALSKTTTKTR
jgi:hypothetical protein